MLYGYTAQTTTQSKTAVEAFTKANKLTLSQWIADTHSNKTYWTERSLYQLVTQTAKPGDAIIVNEAADLVRSSSQMLELFKVLAERNIALYFAKYNDVFTADKMVETTQLLRLTYCIESDFVVKRTTDALARRKAAGLPLGRPKGRKNKGLKLDKHKRDIQKYLDLNVSRASIAKLINCHPQTLYTYVNARKLMHKTTEPKVHVIRTARKIAEPMFV